MSPQRFLSVLLPSVLLASPLFADETTDGETIDVPESEKLHWGVGVRGGARAVPSVGLDLVYDIHPSLKDTLGTSFGLEFIRRKGEVDLRLGFSFEDYTGTDGDGDQFLQKGDAAKDIEFVKNSLQILSVDINVLGSTEITDWWHLLYGAGIGVGVVRGDLLRTDTFAPDATDQNTRRPCTAPGVPDINCLEIDVVEDSVPPVIPVLNMLLGMRFDFSKNVSLRLEGGLRTLSVYTGAGFDFVF
jgi:opacity protein-like surface antigen